MSMTDSDEELEVQNEERGWRSEVMSETDDEECVSDVWLPAGLGVVVLVVCVDELPEPIDMSTWVKLDPKKTVLFHKKKTS